MALLQLHCSRWLRLALFAQCRHDACACQCRLALLLAAGTEGAARKGHSRVRHFGGVVALPVIKRRVCVPWQIRYSAVLVHVVVVVRVQILKENGVLGHQNPKKFLASQGRRSQGHRRSGLRTVHDFVIAFGSPRPRRTRCRRIEVVGAITEASSDTKRGQRAALRLGTGTHRRSGGRPDLAPHVLDPQTLAQRG